MRGLRRAALLIEMAVCFFPALVLLIIGALLLPVQAFALVAEPIHWIGPAWITFVVLAGAAGMWAAARLLPRVLAGGAPLQRPVWTLGAALAGLVASLSLAAPAVIGTVASGEDVGLAVVFMLPVLGGLHLLWLARDCVRPTLPGHLRVIGGHLQSPTLLAPGTAVVLMVVAWLVLRPGLVDRFVSWRQHRPASYVYEPHFAGDRPPHRGEIIRVTVVGERITGAAYVGRTPEEIASVGLPLPETLALTMDGLFERLVAEQTAGASVTVFTSGPSGRIWQADVNHGDRRRDWSVIVDRFGALNAPESMKSGREGEPRENHTP